MKIWTWPTILNHSRKIFEISKNLNHCCIDCQILEWIKKGFNMNYSRHVIKISIINARPWLWLSLTFDLEYKFEIQTWNITWQSLHIIWTPDSSNEISSNCGIFLNFFEVILTEFVIFDSLIFASLFELFVVRNLRKS